MNLEKRFLGAEAQLTVSGDPASPGLHGYAAVYNVRSHALPLSAGRRFFEVIAPGTFAKALSRNPDVRGLLEHDPAKMFGRTKSGTMLLSEDQRGLRFEVPKLPQHGVGPQIVEQLARGDLDSCSFGFFSPKGGDTWSVERIGGEEVALRTLHDVNLADVSLTAFPVYPETTVALRSLEVWTAAQKRHGKQIEKVILEIIAMSSQ